MDLKDALEKMEELLALMDEYRADHQSFSPEKTDKITILYAEIEDVVHQFEGILHIKVPPVSGGEPTISPKYKGKCRGCGVRL